MKREIGIEDKQTAIDKVLDSVTFARAVQLRKLFRWLCDRALDSQMVPTELEVGKLALGRGDGFDPQTDSLVRKEMTRLRAKLRAYYAGEGVGDDVRIRNDDGYRLSFQAAISPLVRPAPPRLSGPNDPACLLVLPFLACEESQSFADTFYDDLLLGLAEMDKLELVARTTARMYAGRSGDVREFMAEAGADHLIEGTVRTKGELIQVVLWLADGQTGRSRLLTKSASVCSEELSEFAAQSVVQKLFPVRAGGAHG